MCEFLLFLRFYQKKSLTISSLSSHIWSRSTNLPLFCLVMLSLHCQYNWMHFILVIAYGSMVEMNFELIVIVIVFPPVAVLIHLVVRLCVRCSSRWSMWLKTFSLVLLYPVWGWAVKESEFEFLLQFTCEFWVFRWDFAFVIRNQLLLEFGFFQVYCANSDSKVKVGFGIGLLSLFGKWWLLQSFCWINICF